MQITVSNLIGFTKDIANSLTISLSSGCRLDEPQYLYIICGVVEYITTQHKLPCDVCHHEMLLWLCMCSCIIAIICDFIASRVINIIHILTVLIYPPT